MISRTVPKRVNFDTRAEGPEIKGPQRLESRSQNVAQNAVLAVLPADCGTVSKCCPKTKPLDLPNDQALAGGFHNGFGHLL